MSVFDKAFSLADLAEEPAGWVITYYYNKPKDLDSIPKDVRDKVKEFDPDSYNRELEVALYELLAESPNQQTTNLVLGRVLRLTEFNYYESVYLPDPWGEHRKDKYSNFDPDLLYFLDVHSANVGVNLHWFWMALRDVMSPDILQANSDFNLSQKDGFNMYTFSPKYDFIGMEAALAGGNSNGLTVGTLALKTFVEYVLGRIEAFPEKKFGSKLAIYNYGKGLGVSGHSFYSCFIKIFNSGGAKGWNDREIDKVESLYESDIDILHVINKLRNGDSFKTP